MADGRTEYEVAAKFTGDGELREAANAFERVGDTGRRALDGIEQKARGGLGLLNLEAGINLVGQALGVVQNVGGAAINALTEGAALSDARGDFADLAAEINTTADALEGRLAQATGGLVTNAQLVSDATNLMGLNLGLSEDYIVSITGAAAELDWNMEALADTLNTGATRGLKEMGLNITEVKGRMAELEAQGVATDEAFRMAILEAAEEKIGRVGRKSEEAAGQIQILQTTVTDAGNTFKEAFAESLVVGIDAAVDGTELLDDAIQRAANDAGTLLGNLSAAFILQFGEESAIKQLEAMGADMDAIREKALQINRETGVGLIELGTTPQDIEAVTRRYAMLTEEIERLRREQEFLDPPRIATGNADNYRAEAAGIRDYTQALADFNQASNQGAYTTPAMRWDSDYYQQTYGDLYQINQTLIDQQTYARDTADAWREYTDALTERGGDLFADFLADAEQATEVGRQWAFDLNQAIFDAANQQGAGADFLSGYAEDIGAAGEDIVAAMEAAQQQALVIDLAAGVREAGIAWSEFPGIVEQAIAEMEGATSQVARAAPSPEDLGFREGWQENFTPQAIDPIEVPLEIQLREDLIDTAIANARGMVEGFTNPDQVYQAVMEMDISAVEQGVGTATQLINGIPTQKTITINWQQSGVDVLAALRALGVIP